MFDELLAHEGVEEIVELRSTFGFMAYHGGSLEEVTDVVATAAAEKAGASLYAVVQPPDFRWHIPSTEVRPEHSAALARVPRSRRGRRDRARLRARGLLDDAARSADRTAALADHVASHLRPALPDYTIATDLDSIPLALRGLASGEPGEPAAGGGVQLELPPRVRGRQPDLEGLGRPGTRAPAPSR